MNSFIEFVAAFLKDISSFTDLIVSFVIGCLSSWLVSRFYHKKSNRDFRNLREMVKENAGVKGSKEFVGLLAKLENETIDKMTKEAHETSNKNLLEKALFLGGLVKMKNGDHLLGHIELSQFSPKLFQFYINYCLAAYVSIGNATGTILLYSLLCEKLKQV
ncbi:hypothetical protein [Desulfobacula phenolica]|uniref:Uncharacterized protein n=1 Tax=Desulfobacula phenolica TaxID=90732 RepID=A0A1H2KBM6_9BACT|nr:hypothetical protein [Desulfobacula phenolica]SDU65871.1 hypothetical protein SAMN04487931_1288 [Desulfobacula phenolica]